MLLNYSFFTAAFKKEWCLRRRDWEELAAACKVMRARRPRFPLQFTVIASVSLVSPKLVSFFSRVH